MQNQRDTIIWTNRIGFMDKIAIKGSIIIIPIALFIMIFFVSILFILAGGTIGEIIGGLAIIILLPLLIIGVLVFLGMAVLHAGTGGGYDATFAVSEKGVGFAGGETMKKVNDTLAIASILTGNPGVAGAGLANYGTEQNFIRWQEIRSITVSKSDNYILIRPQSLVHPIPLYCTKDNFFQVLGILKKYRPDLV